MKLTPIARRGNLAELPGSLEVDTVFRSSIWQQFGAAIDMLENGIRACPDELWGDRSRQPEFWYVVFHALFFLDLNLSGSVEGFAPPAPFTLDELDPAGLLPERAYTKDELQTYLAHCRSKCHETIESMTDEKARERCKFSWVEMTFAELLLYNMRHVQHHAAQLNLILRQTTNSAPRWVAKAKNNS
jgi:DinB superfamily